MYRFADGSYFSGRIEVLHNSTWGTICNHNNGFGDNEAKVFCRSIGLRSVYNKFVFNPNKNKILLFSKPSIQS